MALNATTCYNKAVAAGGYGSYPSPLTAATGVPSAAMVAAAVAAGSVAGGGGGSVGPGPSSSRSGSSGSGSASAGYRAKDFNVPLHVDCSVEYEMPSSAKPPVGGKIEPLLMIHPSYYRKAESRTRSLFVNNMPAASSSSSSGRSRPSITAASACGNSSSRLVVDAAAVADGPPPAKRPYAGPAPGVTASTGAGVYGMVTGAVAAAAGASQWPPLGSSAEHQHHDGKRTMDMVQRQYQQHLQASLPPPMLTAALPTDKTHMTG